MNNDQLTELEVQEQEARRQAEEQAQELFITNLAAHIDRCWEEAKKAKMPIERRIEKSVRLRKGEYEPDQLAAMQALFGADYDPPFIKIVAKKCSDCEAWIKKYLFRPSERCWDIEPTPDPELPPDVQMEITQEIESQYLNAVAAESVMMTGTMDMMDIQARLASLKDEIMEDVKKAQVERAKKLLKRQKVKLDDRLIEGGWYKAVWESIHDISTKPSAFIKGPTIRKETKVRNAYDPMSGQYKRQIQEDILPTWDRVNPRDLFFAPWARSVQDGYIIEKVSYRPAQLSDLIGVEGYDEDAIRAALQDYRQGGLRLLTNDAQTRIQEEGKDSSALYAYDLIDGLEFWGSASGAMLLEWGMEENLDPDLEYNICAWKVGNHVIKAMLNPDPSGHKPYYGASIEYNPDSPWGGLSLPEKIESSQKICNACARAIVHNVGIASGPQIEVDSDRKAPGTDLSVYPWKVWESTNQQMQDGPAVKFSYPPMVVEKLLRCEAHFRAISDEESGIPAYAHGNPNVGGAGETATGLSMLMQGSNRGLEAVLMNIDMGQIEPSIRAAYDLEMEFAEDPNLIGDVKIRAKGATAITAKEQQAVRRTEFLNVTNNPVDIQILGLEGRKVLLKQVADALDIDLGKVLEEQSMIEQMAQQMQAQMLAQSAGQSPMETRETNPDGSVKSGQDNRTFRQGEV